VVACIAGCAWSITLRIDGRAQSSPLVIGGNGTNGSRTDSRGPVRITDRAAVFPIHSTHTPCASEIPTPIFRRRDPDSKNMMRRRRSPARYDADRRTAPRAPARNRPRSMRFPVGSDRFNTVSPWFPSLHPPFTLRSPPLHHYSITTKSPLYHHFRRFFICATYQLQLYYSSIPHVLPLDSRRVITTPAPITTKLSPIPIYFDRIGAFPASDGDGFRLASTEIPPPVHHRGTLGIVSVYHRAGITIGKPAPMF